PDSATGLVSLPAPDDAAMAWTEGSGCPKGCSMPFLPSWRRQLAALALVWATGAALAEAPPPDPTPRIGIVPAFGRAADLPLAGAVRRGWRGGLLWTQAGARCRRPAARAAGAGRAAGRRGSADGAVPDRARGALGAQPGSGGGGVPLRLSGRWRDAGRRARLG